ncbi:MAG: transglutaminase-like domain-containing protein [Bacteroidota bacterium]|nr:transglutaminase-like domain-containing protein [Bacteroidota bacterium]
MKQTYWIVMLVLAGVLSSCGPKDFLIYSDEDYARVVENEFERRRELANNRETELFDVLSESLTKSEKQGLKFLFAFMPLNDLADYDGEFFLGQVRSSLEAREFFHWGVTIPEAEFRHFVLPYRINNENLDTARQVFFEQMKNRIKDMDMLDAALEVNHWCHEKVTYKGTDIRTSSPLATVKTAYGRCGEESTFTVAALRSVAIPARQVYTPRWAHSDDNHAWVEFWANGEWHFMGACEPAAVQNLGWFTEPARRAMLIHTKAFGDYRGTERVANHERQYSLLNTLGVYAPVKEVFVQVLDQAGAPVTYAEVEFQLYNYAEFYPISTKTTDDAGYCSFLTGLGDLQIWAHNMDLFDYSKVTVAETDTLVLTLDQQPYADKADVYDLIPPIERKPLEVSQEGKELNASRLKEEDGIRAAYEATFMTVSDAASMAKKLDLDTDEVTRFIELSRGNYDEIEAFLTQIPEDLRTLGMLLLDHVSLKDLRDTRADILIDHLMGAEEFFFGKEGRETSVFFDYVLNPRVANEKLIAYRDFLKNAWSAEELAAFRENPNELFMWIKDNIVFNEEENYYQISSTPVGVFELKVANEQSVKIFTVAALRTFGYPSRLEPGTDYLQYWMGGDWITFHFGQLSDKKTARGTLKLKNDPDNSVDPKYHKHFSLAMFKDGKYHTLHFDWDKPLADFFDGVELDAGYYMLVTGNRQPGGAVLSQQEYFVLKEGQTLTKTVSLRTSDKAMEILATIDLSSTYQTLDNQDISLDKCVGKEWMVLAWVDPDKEPSKHAFQDLALLKKELDVLDLPFTFVIPENKLTDSFRNTDYSGLPGHHQFLIAKELKLVESLEIQIERELRNHLPVFVIANTNGEIIYLSSGYKIGIGEEIVKIIR